MLVEYPFTRKYLMSALEGSPDVFERLLAGVIEEEMDRRPDPERFTLREAMAHLADWEPIHLERARRIRDEDEPTLPNYDEGRLAIDHDYANRDFKEQIELYRAGRAKVMELLTALPPNAWQRAGIRPEIGRITIEALATLITLHDSYHVRQVIEWRKIGSPA